MPASTAYPSTPQPARPGGSLPGGAEPQLVPYRITPPWGEPALYGEHETGVAPSPVAIDATLEAELLHNRINLAFGHLALPLDWELDDQYGWPPPGAPNRQPFQSGHTSIIVHNQAEEQGWGTDPAFRWPRYPHMENHAARYAHGIFRRNGQWTAEALNAPLMLNTQAWQAQHRRDLRLQRAVQHHVHGVIVADSPSVTNTINTTPVTATVDGGVMIGAEGVLPDA